MHLAVSVGKATLRVLHYCWYMLAFVLPSSSALSDVPEYTAVVGGAVELPCNITVPSADDAISLILWYKGHTGPPFYSIDARNGLVTKAKHFLNKAFNNRGFYDASQSPSSVLRLTSVQEGDAGFYRCRVDYRWARTHSTVSKLFVIVPPKEVIIKDSKGQKQGGVIGPFSQGESLTLTCEAFGGIPSPSVLWWRDGKLLDDSFETTETGSVKNEIFFSNLQRKDLMTTMDCQATNNNETSPASLSVTLDMNLKPLDVRITTPRQALVAGERTDLLCESFGARPKASMAWRKGGNEIHKAKEESSLDSNLTTSTLTFIPRREDDGQYISCRAENPVLPGSVLEDGFLLKVHYVPQMALAALDGQTKATVKEGSTVRLFCNISANPSIVDIAWYFNKKSMFNSASLGRAVQNQTLMLENVTRKDRGRYHCIASNAVGKGESNDFNLVVLYGPVCRPGLKIAYGAARGETVKVICEVESDPPENTFAWKFNNTVLDKEVSSFVSHKVRSVASYTPRSMNDFGNLYCWGQNAIGVQKMPCMFSIVPAGPPDQLENCLVTNFTTETITVDCQPGDSNGLQPSYFVELYNLAQEDLERNISRSDSPNFHIVGLTPGTPYLMVLYASNLKGKSDPVTLKAQTQPAAQKQVGKDTETPISPLLGIFTGVILAMVLGAVVIIVVLRHKRQQKERGRSSSEAKSEGKAFPSSQNSPDVVPLRSEYYADNWNHDQEWCPVRCVKATQKYYDNLGSTDRRYHEVEMNVFHDVNEVPSEEESHQRLYMDQAGYPQHHLPYSDVEEGQWDGGLVELERTRYCPPPPRTHPSSANTPCSSYYEDVEPVPTWPKHEVRIKSTMI